MAVVAVVGAAALAETIAARLLIQIRDNFRAEDSELLDIQARVRPMGSEPRCQFGILACKGCKMSAEQSITLEGKIVTVLAGTMFRVELDNKHQVLAHISGKMRKRFIRLTPGDRVRMEMSPYDLDKARIVYRLG